MTSHTTMNLILPFIQAIAGGEFAQGED